MTDTGVNLEINPEVTAKLSAGQKLWFASRDDGSANRINGDAVLEAGSYSVSLGVLAALGMWIRKKFRNRGKTKEDFAAEKEAAEINRTCVALEQMLLEYIQSAQKGVFDAEAVGELNDTLEAMQRYDQAGKLVVPGRKELAEIRKSIADYTEAMAKSKSVQPDRTAGTARTNEFGAVRELLKRQAALLES